MPRSDSWAAPFQDLQRSAAVDGFCLVTVNGIAEPATGPFAQYRPEAGIPSDLKQFLQPFTTVAAPPQAFTWQGQKLHVVRHTSAAIYAVAPGRHSGVAACQLPFGTALFSFGWGHLQLVAPQIEACCDALRR